MTIKELLRKIVLDEFLSNQIYLRLTGVRNNYVLCVGIKQVNGFCYSMHRYATKKEALAEVKRLCTIYIGFDVKKREHKPAIKYNLIIKT